MSRSEVLMIRHTMQRLSVFACLVGAIACADSIPTAPTPEASLAVQGSQDRLAAWFTPAAAAVLALPRTVFADNDEKAGKLVFGVEDASAIGEVRATLTRLGVPSADYSVEVTPPIHAMATLRDRFRPTQAGSQIHFFLYVC